MRRPFVHSLIAWLCLFAFGFDMAAHAMQPVVCSSGGDERVEWVCEKDERGSCLGSVTTEDASDRPAEQGLPPCEDRPVGDDHDLSHHQLTRPTPHGQELFTFPLVMMALPPSFTFDPYFRCGSPFADVRVRPPDAVARLRTVIMIV
ncbi:MAG: hypothetical protein ACK4WH_01705 [Phycisphaerales bacterium]